MMKNALESLYGAAAACGNEQLTKEVTDMGNQIYKIIMNTNSKLNITETDITA
jgi:hypothetical protein